MLTSKREMTKFLKLFHVSEHGLNSLKFAVKMAINRAFVYFLFCNKNLFHVLLLLLGKKWAHIVRKLHFLPSFHFILIESEEKKF